MYSVHYHFRSTDRWNHLTLVWPSTVCFSLIHSDLWATWTNPNKAAEPFISCRLADRNKGCEAWEQPPALKLNCKSLFGLLFLFCTIITIWPNVPSLFIFFFFLHLFICQGAVSIDHLMHLWVAIHFIVDICMISCKPKPWVIFFSLNIVYLTTSNIQGPSCLFSVIKIQ